MIHDESFGSPERRRTLTVVVLLMFALLVLRLYQLQLLFHVELDKKSEENSVRALTKDPVRGYMYDRYGRLFVDVGPSYSVTLIPAEFEKQSAGLLSSILQMEPKVLDDRIARARTYSPFLPARIKRDVDMKTLAAIEEHLSALTGVSYQVESKRVYPTLARASHLLGYRREISDAQLSTAGDYYRPGDLVGVAGLEARLGQGGVGDAQRKRVGGVRIPMEMLLDVDLHAKRAAAPDQSLRLDSGRNQQTSRRRRIEEQIRRLGSSAQQLAYLVVVHPQEARRSHQRTLAEHRASLVQRAPERLGRRG